MDSWLLLSKKKFTASAQRSNHWQIFKNLYKPIHWQYIMLAQTSVIF
jgi:hypothetical protein